MGVRGNYAFGPMRSAVIQVLRGFAMGSADLVPGVSGGTIALVLGIYRRLVAAIRMGSGALAALIRLDLGESRRRFRAIDWRFLVPLLAGIALAVFSLSTLISHLLETQPVRMAGLFFGLVAASIAVGWRMIHHHDGLRLTLMVATAVAMFLLLGLSAGPVSNPSLPVYFGSGVIAICAMILPGISGSFVLLMMGMYQSVIGAVSDRDFVVIAVFGIGAVIGLALFSTLLDRLLRDHHDTVMAVLVGMMAGSLRVLWPWPEGTGGTTLGAPTKDLVIPILLALAGAALVLALSGREEVVETEAEDFGLAAEVDP